MFVYGGKHKKEKRNKEGNSKAFNVILLILCAIAIIIIIALTVSSSISTISAKNKLKTANADLFNEFA